MNRLATLLVFLAQGLWGAVAHSAEATPAEIYAQAVRIELEVASLKRHWKVAGEAKITHRNSAESRPAHVWSRCYVILLKLGKLRRHLGLPYVEPIGIEPSLDMPLNPVWGMTQRILNEIHILKFFLDVPGEVPATALVAGKRLIDADNTLTRISHELDLLAGPVTATEVYAEAMRINEEVNAVLRHLGVFERAVPPPRPEALEPEEVLRAAIVLLEEVRRIERVHGMAMPELQELDTGDKAALDEALIMVEFALAEFDRVKARIGMAHRVAVPSTYAQDKKPADVVQLLGYITDKLRQIRPR